MVRTSTPDPAVVPLGAISRLAGRSGERTQFGMIARIAVCECVPLFGGEGTECGPRRSLAEQGQDVSAVLVPIREFIGDVPAPGSDHRKHKSPALR